MTEQELTALAINLSTAPPNQGRPQYGRDLAKGYLTLLTERDALKAQLEAMTRVVTPDYGCTCHSSAGCPLHTWTNPWVQP